MKLISFLLTTFLVCTLQAQVKVAKPSNNQLFDFEVYINQRADSIFNKLVSIRRDLYANPELAGKEIRTKEVILKYLLSLGLDVKADIYGNAVVGILRGAKKGKSIAWRADMDALPNNFEDDADFKSKNKGVQHGCGHDVHIVIALGIAEVLASQKSKICGTFYFIFQPEEETFAGANNMLKNGLLNQITPSEIYGLHITPFPVGQIIVKPNEMFAYQRRIQLHLNDTLTSTEISQFKTNLTLKINRHLPSAKPWELEHLLNPQNGLCSNSSIYNDYAFVDENYFTIYIKNKKQYVEFYIYETRKENLNQLLASVKQQCNHEGWGSKIKTISFVQNNPTINNNKLLTQKAFHYLSKNSSQNLIILSKGQVPFSNDDFAFFQQKIKGVYFYLGASNFQKGLIAMIHAPNFKVDEECIRVGVKCFAKFLNAATQSN